MSENLDLNKDLMPELASFMEDTSVEVDVEVGAPEAVEEETAAVEATEEAAEVTEEAAETEETVEMVFRRMDELERMHAHIQKYGVSREFMAWHNYDGKLAASLGVSVPETESLDAIGDPNSALAIACCESIGSAIKKGATAVWEFIKKVCSKIASFVKRIFEWIRRVFTSTNRNVGRLREAAKTRVLDKEKAKDAKAKIFKLDEVKVTINVSDVISKLSKAVENIRTIASSRMKEENAEKKVAAEIDSLIGSMIDSAKAVLEKADKERPTASEQNLEPLYKDINGYLDNAAAIGKFLNDSNTVSRMLDDAAKGLEKGAKEAQQRGDKDAESVKKVAQKLASYLTKAQSDFTKLVKYLSWCANQSVKSASVILTRCSKKK